MTKAIDLITRLRNNAHNLRDRGLPRAAETMDDALAKIISMKSSIEGFLDILEHVNVSSGTCCCGDEISNHSNPMACGHAPVDSGQYAVSQSAEVARELLKDLSTPVARSATLPNPNGEPNA